MIAFLVNTCLSPVNLCSVTVTSVMILEHKMAKEKIFSLPFMPHDCPKLQNTESVSRRFLWKVNLGALWMKTGPGQHLGLQIGKVRQSKLLEVPGSLRISGSF